MYNVFCCRGVLPYAPTTKNTPLQQKYAPTTKIRPYNKKYVPTNNIRPYNTKQNQNLIKPNAQNPHPKLDIPHRNTVVFDHWYCHPF